MEEKKSTKRRLLMIILLFLCIILVTVIAWWYLKPKETEAPFAGPAGMTLAADGSIYVVDSENNNVIRMKEEKTWLAAGYTLPLNAQGISQGGYSDGDLKKALFHRPYDVVEWGDGLAVSDRENHCIRLIVGGNVRTLTGSGTSGYVDGIANQAEFSYPAGLATDEHGNLYIADSGNGVVRCLSINGMVSTVVSDLKTPMGLCWYEGELYITESEENQILKLSSDGILQEIAGTAYTETEMERRDGDAAQATFSAPNGIEISDGIIYVADTGFGAVRKIENGQVTTMKSFEGTGNDLWPSRPIDIVRLEEKLYVSDEFNGVIFTIEIE